jgi:hypothetical protein
VSHKTKVRVVTLSAFLMLMLGTILCGAGIDRGMAILYMPGAALMLVGLLLFVVGLVGSAVEHQKGGHT